jgi:hypothetical protein
MRAYKFLDGQQRAPFTLTPWRQGEWIETAAAVPCHEGVHACRAEHLSFWLAAALWEVELDGQVIETRHKLTARRGRLVAEIGGYQDAASELGSVCAGRARDRAVDALRAAGAAGLADRFAAARELDALRALAADVDDSTFASTAAALAVDTARFAIRGPITEAPFIGACSRGHVEAGPDGDRAAFEAGFAAERAFESAWLVERLGLAVD